MGFHCEKGKVEGVCLRIFVLQEVMEGRDETTIMVYVKAYLKSLKRSESLDVELQLCAYLQTVAFFCPISEIVLFDVLLL